MKRLKRNFKGEIISGIKELEKKEFGKGTFDRANQPMPDWSYHAKNADSHGFDTKNREKNGSYLIQLNLPKGTELIRYGDETGKYTAPVGTEYEALSLPYKKETLEYNQYRVIADNVTVFCQVEIWIDSS